MIAGEYYSRNVRANFIALRFANFPDYLRESYRTLKFEGHLHIIEATERFSNRGQVAKDLENLGFDIIRIEDKWKFTHIWALKTEQQPYENIILIF